MSFNPFAAQAHEDQQEVLVGSELDYPPYADVDEEGNADGFSVDLIKAAAKQVGIKLKFEVGPWAEMKAKLERGEIDALPLVAYSTEREKYFDFSTPHIVSHAVVFIRKGEKRFHSLEDLRGKEVIVMRADSTHEYVKFSAITDKIILTKTVGESFQLLASGKHDFVIAPKLSGLLLLNELGIDNIEPFGEPLEAYGKGYSFAVHEGDRELLEHLDRGLVLVKASGEYDQIYDKWFGHVDPREDKNAELIKLILTAVIILVLIVLIGFIWNLMLRRKVAIKTKELLESETRFAATFAEAAMGLAHVAPDGSWLRVNQALCDIVGYSEEELLKLTFQDITHPDDLNTDMHFVEQMLAGEINQYSMEKRYFRKDGTIIWVNLTVSLLSKANGEPDYFISAVEDISERKSLDAQVRQSKDELETFFDLVPDMVCVATPDGYFKKINNTWSNVLGYSDDELLSRPYFEFVHPEDQKNTHEVAATLVQGKKVFQFSNRYRCKNGGYRWLEWVSAPGLDGTVYAVARDITERREAEELILKERNLAQKYLDVAGVMMVVLDPQGRVTLINREGLDILGYEESELLHQSWFEVCLPKESVEEVRSVFDQIISGGHELMKYYENSVITKSGEQRILAFHNALLTDRHGNITGLLSSGEDITESRLAVEKLNKLSQAIEQAGEGVVITDANGTIEYINSAYSRITGYDEADILGKNPRVLNSGKQSDEFYESMWGTLTKGEVWQGRIIDQRKDETLYPALLTISPIRDEEDNVTHYVGVQQNLKEYEDLEVQFQQAQKMEAIGTLVGGIAHDFNNALAGITSNLYLARKKSSELDVIGNVKSAEKLAFSAAGTIQQLLAFSRKGVVNMGTLSIAPFLKEIIKLHRVAIPENIEIKQLVEESGLKIRGDINQLQQMLMNLMNNARDALEGVENPQISLILSHELVRNKSKAKPGQVKNGEYACITVMDNGCGISDEHREHIFEPFYTTKEAGKGTGLGLSMSYGAVKTHGGWIFALPGEDGIGTVLKVYLPLVDLKADLDICVDSDEVVDGKGETILLVDDNQIVLEVGKELLEGLNYHVLTATDGLEAISVYSEHQDHIDLLLLDVVMPRMGGMEALKEMRRINPDVKAIFATGYNKVSAMGESDEFQAEKVLAKPLAISELSQALRDKLNS
ncbi:PAS domain S-box protein [Mariprofundus sp. NF]|uniref:PAS domain S-box protein n=1 Tax=Mariprofundus sp. NF TaxID=2608716 RepID=UPI0015A40CD1